LQLAYFEGLSASEISERVGASVETVRNTMQLEMKKLRDRLETPQQ